MLDWQQELRSKEFRRDARRIAWPIAFGLSAGPGNFAGGFLVAWLGFKAWDRFVAPELQHDREAFRDFCRELRQGWKIRMGR
jgi:hypothetical protein